MMGIQRHGSCLCGKVSFDAVLPMLSAHVCHCRMCRKSGSGPSISVDCEELKIKGEEHVTWYRSSEEAERGFCKACGSSLFFRLVDGHYMNVSAAALDREDDVSLKMHIYVDCKPPYYDIADRGPRLTEKEFLAKVEEKNHVA